uniref:NLE domain-containing protein n=1 Tax=Trichuris muris TaxID=70415 RepID=A0A5S6Q287_TRIMR
MLTDKHYQVNLTSANRTLFPDTSLSLIERAGPEELNILARKLYSDFHGVEESEKQFDFLIQKVLLRTSIGDFVVDNNLSSENVIVVECIDREPAPDPCFSLPHKDWVSGVRCASDCIISSCYDGTVHAWNLAARPIGHFKAHEAIINGLCIIPGSMEDENVMRIATASADQSVVMTEFDRSKSKFIRTHVGHGHEEAALCVSSNTLGSRLATGGSDNYLKIWNANSPKDVAKDWTEEPSNKPTKVGASNVAAITPIVTLAGHRSRITGTCWMNEDHVITSSWDHTICVWDTILLDRVSSLACTCSLTAVSYSPLNQLLISGSVDDYVRLWDPRSNEGKMVRSVYVGHSKWVSAVDWSKTNEHLFVSASYDGLMKLWDFRSTKVALYDLSGHSDRLLCCDFSSPTFMLSGGVDGTVNVYRTTKEC